MKLLRIKVANLPLFKNTMEINFFAKQNVQRDENRLYNIFGNIYQNNVNSFVGINASGKTTVLKVIIFTLRMINNEPINSIEYKDILGCIPNRKPVVFDIYFFSSEMTIQHLHTEILSNSNGYFIENEYLESKNANKTMAKKDLIDFSKKISLETRNKDEKFLLSDVSIMVAFNKKNKESIFISDMLKYTDNNQLNVDDDFPTEIVSFFDPSIEYIYTEKKANGIKIRLKFKDEDEITLTQLKDLNHYLSSGTIKGINVFMNAKRTFDEGGYMIIDEIENHFNKEIVMTLIRFYMNQRINKKGAGLIFSTHYSEILDEFERNDCIYIVRNKLGITIQSLSDILVRNDIKKSDAFQSGFLEGTVPSYQSYLELKKVFDNSKA